MKLIESNQAYEILDTLFYQIQKNDYKATQKMLDDAHGKWCDLPKAYDVDKVVEQIWSNYDPNIDRETGEYCNNWVVDMQNEIIEQHIEIVRKGGING